MARGNIYELRRDAEAAGNITEEMFYVTSSEGRKLT